MTDLETAVYQAIGAASMCWEHPEHAGVFYTEQAERVAENLLILIRKGGDRDPA